MFINKDDVTAHGCSRGNRTDGEAAMFAGCGFGDTILRLKNVPQESEVSHFDLFAVVLHPVLMGFRGNTTGLALFGNLDLMAVYLGPPEAALRNYPTAMPILRSPCRLKDYQDLLVAIASAFLRVFILIVAKFTGLSGLEIRRHGVFL